LRQPTSGGGWQAIRYAWRKSREAGGLLKFYRALRSRNACKTCALGMGGQRGGMVNELGHFPEVCKKSMQAMAADMQGAITPEFFARYSIDQMRAMSSYDLEHVGRLATPVFAGADDTHYRAIAWDEALAFCAKRLKAVEPDETFFYSSGRASNEAAFLWQLFARLYGTNNVNNCSYYCHQASGAGLTSVFGSGTATIVLDDLAHCDRVFLIGGNPASNHPRMMTLLADVRRRGGQVIVINPLREPGLVNFRIPSRPMSLFFGSEIASLYVQPHIGGDIALLTGVAKRIHEMQAMDQGFLRNATEGSAEFLKHLRGLSWDEITAGAGVDRETINKVARMYAQSRATIFSWTMGITHHEHGVDNVRAIANLAMLRGMVGRPHAGMMPIRGHSNVQGVGSVGVTPKLREAIFERLETHFGVKLPTTPGMDTLTCMQGMSSGRLRTAFCLGGNLYGSNPDSRQAAADFAKLDAAVYLSTTLNTGHAWGRAKQTLILPVKARDEESQATTQESMFNYVRMSDGGPERLGGPRSEVAIVADLASRVLESDGPVDWESLREHRNIRDVIAKVVPGFEAIGEIDETGREFQIEGRTFHTPTFATPSGKARFHITPLPALAREKDELRLMTIRSEGQFNTVVYEEEDLYRGQERRDVILMNDKDIARLGLTADQPAKVVSRTGTIERVIVRTYPIPPGNAAMYFPEANVLVPRSADPGSGTPAFKSVVVRVKPVAATSLPVTP
jgi:molybdopterin-dependent oxidoreductase alpha subunit